MEAVRAVLDAQSLFAGIEGWEPQYRAFARTMLSSQFHRFTG